MFYFKLFSFIISLISIAFDDENGDFYHQGRVTDYNGNNHTIVEAETKDFFPKEISTERTREQNRNITSSKFQRFFVGLDWGVLVLKCFAVA